MGKSGSAGDIAIIGRSCRLPGAASVEQLWANLLAARCSVTEIPADRWARDRFGHPRPKEPGRSYVWSAGVIEDIWRFDPGVFGISPREAEQMDPHQRLLLELTWEALEDAGIRPADVAATEVGVYVGASSTEYQNLRNVDPAGSDAYTATGGALSIVANRVSHVFDFRGPSFTVDTACSSSLVAAHQAVEGLRRGEMDMAVVGGVNLLLGPLGFVMFSQATMLSPTGLCRTFDANADGYVRSEGGVVLLLKTLERALADGDPIFGRIVASGVNSDGRTNGIALPSRHSQTALLKRIYGGAGIDPASVAFVEAHGTGTRVGDPIEASTIGEVLGVGRSSPLKIGSIKSNIGHLEPASGLAGILKATLALEHDVLPPSLHFEEPNPDIAFDDLGLEVVNRPAPLPRGDRPRHAGVNSFGFGGTNAHVVVGDGPRRDRAGGPYAGTSDLLALSAASRPALADLAARYAARLAKADFGEAREVAAAAVYRRQAMAERLVLEWGSPRDLVRKLERLGTGETEVPGATYGSVTETDAPVAFVFSGNGGHWPGMGRAPYRANRRFRETFDEIDAIFDTAHGWSLTEALFADDLEERLRQTHVAQPLLFALQMSVTRALEAEGLRPDFVLGHSVGEIAAAAAAGILSLRDAIEVIHARSEHQELIRDTGRMAVVVGTAETVAALCEEVGGVEIAAENSPRTYTVAGDTTSVARLGALAKSRRIVFRQLDLAYPFHSHLVAPVRDPLLADLAGLALQKPTTAMISTVSGEPVTDLALDAEYWWRNVREPVRFATAVEQTARLGARVFVEIGPRSLLLSNIGETLDGTSLPYATLGVLERVEAEEPRDPIRPAVIRAFVRGARLEAERFFGPRPSRPVSLPSYPWQRRDLPMGETTEVAWRQLDAYWHRLLGGRNTPDGLEWANTLDTTAQPELADHEVGGQAILPGAAFIEIALQAARDWFGTDAVAIRDFEIVQALPLERDRARELRTRFSPQTGMLELLSRPRLAKSDWVTHAAARLVPDGTALSYPERPDRPGDRVDSDLVYGAAEATGLRYGPAFRLLDRVERLDSRQLLVRLASSDAASRYGVDPARLDACFHGLFALFEGLDAGRRGMAYIPVRFGQVRIDRPEVEIASCLIELNQVAESAIVADFILYDRDGAPIGALHDARFQGVRVQRANHLPDKALVPALVALDRGSVGRPGLPIGPEDIVLAAEGLEDATTDGADVLLEGWAEAAAFEVARGLLRDGVIGPDAISGLPPDRARWLHAGLRALEAGGLASEGAAGWTLDAAGDLPAAATILRTLAAEHPERSAELILASRLTADPSGSDLAPSTAAIDGLELGGTTVRSAGEAIARLLDQVGALRAPGRGVRILLVGYGPLAHELAETARREDARLTVVDLDPRRIERAKLALRGAGSDFIGDAAAVPKASFDIVVSAEGLTAFRRRSGLANLKSALAPGGLLVAIEPQVSLFRDLTLGLTEGWFDPASPDTFPLSPMRTAPEWAAEMRAEGLRSPQARKIATASGEAVLVVAGAGESEAAAAPRGAVLIAAEPDQIAAGHLAERLADLLAKGDRPFRAAAEPARAGETAVFVSAGVLERDISAGLRDTSLAILACLQTGCLDGSEFVVVVPSKTADPLADPYAAAVLAYCRTLANEHGGVTIRRVVVSGDVSEEQAAGTVASLLTAPQIETDFVVTTSGVDVLRFLPAPDAPSSLAEGPARLERSPTGGLSGIAWQAAGAARGPGTGEIRVAVEATGLNFRDVMWAMSLLPDDILEDGFAGATLGLECAGRVEAVGPGVTRFQVGDRVLAFAPSAFQTAVCVPEAVAAPVPAGWTTEAAASVPVTFLTAYYGLKTLARLKKGEWVLIHGAAGGVGLAAIQIAQRIGATVVATAGSPEKRALLRCMGVEHVLDSRSTSFADELRGIRREGVHVVLNSLFGEAMERSLGTLAPFGRFVELGKRDYVANTRIGLRPFRKNLSYFGVDVDQLLSDQERAGEVFGELMELFASGDLDPLPYRVFSANETVDAFRLMQQSGHVGKILVRPPHGPVRDARSADFAFASDRTHLVTGGFGGFGLEAARWLADRGARHIALMGRNGAASDDAKALVAELEGRGVVVASLACDISDERATAAALAKMNRSMPPIGGVLHGAMVLEDGLAANLTAEQLDRVFAPKIRGALVLDKLLGDLDYLVYFSSITTFIGNPGQSAYVAANAFLEGLARQRRAAGKPALALAWGAIADVGILARQKGLAEALSKRVGVKAMPAREALDLMAQALGSDLGPVIAVGSLDWGAARRLPALASPTFGALTSEGSVADASEKTAIDLQALIVSEPEEKVRKIVLDVIVEEIATVLRVPRLDVSPTKRLAEMGLDSLMAIELATALQDRFALDATPSGSVAALTTVGLADHLIGSLQAAPADETARVTQAVNERHAGVELDQATMAPVLDALAERMKTTKGRAR